MSYEAQEISREDGSPVELYRWDNGIEEFYHTSGAEAVSFGGNLYLPAAIKRTNITVRQREPASTTLQITMPNTEEYVGRYVSGPPFAVDRLTIFRFHATDGGLETITYFEGDVSTVKFNQATGLATVLVSPVSGVFSQNTPRRSYSGLCQNVLYDDQCKAVESNFSFAVTVTAVSANGLTITVSGAGIGSQAAGYFPGGRLKYADPQNPDQRYILSFDGTDTLTIQTPFRSLGPGASMLMSAGCAHDIDTCRDKFSNDINYGGFPLVPNRNLFKDGVVVRGPITDRAG